MLNPRGTTLFKKTLLGQILLFGSVALTTCVFSGWTLYQELTESYRSKGSAIATSLANTSESSSQLIDDSPESLQTVVDEFKKIQGVGYVFIVDSNQNIVIHTFVPRIPSTIQKIATDTYQTGELSIQDLTIKDVGEFEDITAPVFAGTAGYVHIGMDRGLVLGQIRAAISKQIAIIFILFLLSVLATYLLVKRISQPLNQLTQYAQRLASQDFEATINIKSDDEIGILATTMQSMAKDIQGFIEQVETTNTNLQRLDKLKDEFLANTSHELRTPLNGIIGIADSLLEGATGSLPATTQTNLAMIVASGRRLTNLVNDILDFSKLRHQTIELQLKPIEISAIVEVVLTLSKPLIQSKSLELINAVPENLPLVQADENRVQQILLNLVGNAIKFTAFGSVQVSADVVDHSVAITIADTGIGISEDKFDRVFESFEQAEGSTAREYGGTGLGLAITKQLVELHGGQLSLRSTIGSGSSFTFTLPIATAQPDVTAQPERQSTTVSSTLLRAINEEMLQAPVSVSPESELAAGRALILIVDDDPINRQVLFNYLTLQNYAIEEAASGVEALAVLDNGPKPDLILLDVMMPRMTGYEVTQIIRQQFSAANLPILLLTAKTQVSDLVEGLSVGANDYLTKPISKDELIARIRTHLNLRQLRDENLRLSAELDVTRRLQRMLLPADEELNQIHGLDIAGYMEAADEVGGDYYDVLNQNGKVKIGIGDVTGHGLESGVLMLMTQTAIRTLQESNQTDPVQFMSILNRTIYKNTARMNSDKNLTLAIVDYDQGQLYLTGQHEEMLVIRATGQVERIDTIDLGFPIGLDEDITPFVDQVSVILNSNDIAVLYTDGITEAENVHKQQYGLERLIEVVRRDRQFSAAEIKEAVIRDVQQHINGHKVFDDITLLVLKQR